MVQKGSTNGWPKGRPETRYRTVAFNRHRRRLRWDWNDLDRMTGSPPTIFDFFFSKSLVPAFFLPPKTISTHNPLNEREAHMQRGRYQQQSLVDYYCRTGYSPFDGGLLSQVKRAMNGLRTFASYTSAEPLHLHTWQYHPLDPSKANYCTTAWWYSSQRRTSGIRTTCTASYETTTIVGKACSPPCDHPPIHPFIHPSIHPTEQPKRTEALSERAQLQVHTR